MSLRVEPVGPGHADALADLFARTDSPCHCRWWHFQGDKNAWLDRCANAPERNRDELIADLQAPLGAPRGVVALAGDADVVGWMKLSPATTVPKIYDQRPWKGLASLSDREGVLTIGCFLVDAAWRRRGVTGSLLDAGIAVALGTGARAIDAFPRTRDVGHESELWTGALEPFQARGFRELHAVGPYRALRRVLTGDVHSG